MKFVRQSLLSCVLSLLVLHDPSRAQTDTLAMVYGVPITAAEFIRRWELSVYPGKDRRAVLDSTKMRFLYSLIAEQLLARAPVSITPAADSSLENMRKETESALMRDALFRRDVTDKIVVTRREMEEGIRFSAYTHVIDAFQFADSADAVRFLRKFRSSDSTRIYAAVSNDGIVNSRLSVSFGETQEDVERSFFGKQHGFMSNPVRSKGAYAVIRVLSRSTDTKYAAMSPQDRMTTVKKKILERRMDADGWRYIVDVMRTIRAEVNPGPFNAIVRDVQRILRKQEPGRRAREFHLTSHEFDELRTGLADRLDQTLVQFPDQSMTVREAIETLPFSDFAPKDTTARSIEGSLRGALRFASQNRYLVRRARDLGLQHAPEVQSDVQMFLDAGRASEVAATIRAGVTVTPAERDSFYAVRRDKILGDVRLFLRIGTVKTLSEASDLLQRLQAAGVGSLRPPPDTTEILTRWVAGSEIGEFGAALARLAPGDVYGPITQPHGYTVFQLLENKTTVADSSLAQSIADAERRLLDEKRAIVLNGYIAGQAREAHIRIYRTRVTATRVLPSQMYSVRYIGFGGRINAVPMLPPRETWIRYAGSELQVFP